MKNPIQKAIPVFAHMAATIFQIFDKLYLYLGPHSLSTGKNGTLFPVCPNNAAHKECFPVKYLY